MLALENEDLLKKPNRGRSVPIYSRKSCESITVKLLISLLQRDRLRRRRLYPKNLPYHSNERQHDLQILKT